MGAARAAKCQCGRDAVQLQGAVAENRAAGGVNRPNVSAALNNGLRARNAVEGGRGIRDPIE